MSVPITPVPLPSPAVPVVRSQSVRRTARRSAATVAAVGLTVLLSACSAGTESGSAASWSAMPADATANTFAGAGAAPAAGVADAASDPAKSSAGAGRDTSATALTGATARSLVETASLVIRVPKLAPAADKVRALAAAYKGSVALESTWLGGNGNPVPPTLGLSDSSAAGEVAAKQAASASEPVRTSSGDASAVTSGQSVLVLRIPQPRLDAAITELTSTVGGTLLSRSGSTQDVTGDVADLTSRTASAHASVDRIRLLMAKATSLQDVVLLESELSKREADLEALEARLASLNDSAALGTLTVVLTTGDAPAPTPSSTNPFLQGLRDGWHAVGTSTGALLTVLGGLVPFAVLALILFWPVRWLWRRFARRTGTPTHTPTLADPSRLAPPPSS